MKLNKKSSLWNQMRSPLTGKPHLAMNSSSRALHKVSAWFILFGSVIYVIYAVKLLSSSCIPTSINQTRLVDQKPKTGLEHIVFGIASSASSWERRKSYVKLWWEPDQMRGMVWVDKRVKGVEKEEDLPPLKISGDTSRFAYTFKDGHRSAIRISRIVSEVFKLGMKDVRWFVMGDDDTVFIADNLVRVLSKYDHEQFYYIGSTSESHLQNLKLSYNMAYGGGGFAISYPLAKALYRMHDGCIQRYPELYGSDDRMQACMAELGVPLTREIGFHQYDVYGSLFGLLSAHPVAPLVSLHHLDMVEPIFPGMTELNAVKHLTVPMRLDSAALMQLSICYDESRSWTISVSWGYAVQMIRGLISPREMEVPTRTFFNWDARANYTAHAFNTRAVSRNDCQKPFVFHMSTAKYDSANDQTISEYVQHGSRVIRPSCNWTMEDPSVIDRIQVYKRPDPHLWEKSPRRTCCRILPSRKKSSIMIDVGECTDDEISELQYEPFVRGDYIKV